MAQTLENIKGGGGSIKVGAVGTIGALMSRELESANSAPQTSSISRSRIQTAPVSVPCGATPRRQQARRSLEEASRSGKSQKVNNSCPEAPRRSKGYTSSSRQVLMLGSDNISLDRTPSRENIIKKGPQLVDIKCVDPRKSWVNPVANRLQKLGFAKLPETIV